MEKPEFVEYSFVMPFYEMYFPDIWNESECPRNAFELNELCKELDIVLDTDFLFEEYEKIKPNSGDIFIFYSKYSKDIFLYFDLFNDVYDQTAMIKLGVRIPTKDSEEIKHILMKLYFKSVIRSNFQEDYFIHSLWREATNQYSGEKRNIIHFLDGKRLKLN